MENTEAAKKSNVKLKALLAIEKSVQTKWEEDKIFEENPTDYSM